MDLAQENTLLQLQHRPMELGRIRLGHKVSRNGKEYPGRLEEWRLTSASRSLLDAAAALYGGEVKPWADAPDEGYFELYTESRELRVLIPTSLRTVSQAYELWQGGTCERRCDGTVEQLSGGPCLCDPASRECEPMTRVSIMLPDVPGLGVWRLDTGGWHAATSLPATIELLKQLSTAKWIPAILRLEQRSKKVREDDKVVTHRFAVPVLDLPNITVGKVVARMAQTETPLELPPKAPPPTAAERAQQRAAAITSGPDAGTSGNGPGQGEQVGRVAPPATTDDPPDSSEDAGPPHVASAISVSAPSSAEAAPRCLAFSPEHGRCVRDGGHKGNHQSAEQESWL